MWSHFRYIKCHMSRTFTKCKACCKSNRKHTAVTAIGLLLHWNINKVYLFAAKQILSLFLYLCQNNIIIKAVK